MNIYVRNPGLSLRSNPGLKLANAFGVNCCHFKLMHYQIYLAEPSTDYADPILCNLGIAWSGSAIVRPDR